MRKGTLHSCSLTLSPISLVTQRAGQFHYTVDLHHGQQDGSGCRLMSTAKQLCSEGWICSTSQRHRDGPGPWRVACACESHLALSLMLAGKLGLISCRMPTNLFIKASWKQNWETQLVVSQKMYLHEVYFKGTSIPRHNAICDVRWVWHLKMSDVSTSSLYLADNATTPHQQGLFCWFPA